MFAKVCGPIGGDRLDQLAAFNAMYAAGAEKLGVQRFHEAIPWVESVFTAEDDEYELEPGEFDFDDEYE